MVENVTIGDQLEGFAGMFPGCRVIALADLSTGLVLAANSRADIAQEKIDALCGLAVRVWADAETATVDRLLARDGQGVSRATVIVGADHQTCIVSDAGSGDEALCFLFDRNEPVAEALACAAELLDTIEATA